MLQFFNPIWLFTASAVALPLLIHLWNLRKGKRLKIGSLLLITQSIQPTARQMRLTEWLLLLLRCLLIVLLALLLAGPYWQHNPGNSKQKGWVLVPQESIGEIYPAFKKEIDSLVQNGFELHAFNFPFDRIGSNATNNNKGAATSYWQRLGQLNNRLPAGFPVAIFSAGSMEKFKGTRPEVSLAVHWRTLPSGTEVIQLVKALALGTDSIALKFLVSNARKNSFTLQHISSKTSTAAVKLIQTDSGRFVQWHEQGLIRIDTKRLRITVYQKAQKQDGRYITAALEAIRPLLDQPIVISQAKDAISIPAGQDWVFWLSDEPIRSNLASRNYFVYANGETSSINSTIITGGNTSAAPAVFALYKRTKYSEGGETIWTDGFGQPILAKEQANTYRFYSRFDPAWNNLVWQAAFPELIYGLLQKDQNNDLIDRRQIDTAQLAFHPIAETTKTTSFADQADLSGICWWILLFCFAAERWFALYPKTKARAA